MDDVMASFSSWARGPEPLINIPKPVAKRQLELVDGLDLNRDPAENRADGPALQLMSGHPSADASQALLDSIFATSPTGSVSSRLWSKAIPRSRGFTSFR